VFTLAGEVRRLGARTQRAGLGGLEPGAAWLARNQPPPAQSEVICHGDFHALNIVVDGGRLSGVVDWARAIVAEPAYDVAGTRTLMRFGNMGLRPPVRWLVDLARVLPVRRYTRIYRKLRPLDERNMPYFVGMRALSALYRHFERITGVRVRL
jgi:aminoglycoside phosphotransferase (APT) family kinase protein